jgi:adenine-specific DNA-methyltransferase
MQISPQTPRKFLNPLLSQKSIVSNEFAAFKEALVKYAQEVQQLKAEKQSEPNIVAGALMSFLKAPPLAYNCRPHSQKGQSGIDLAILSGTDVAVIIEAKVVGSKDMITTGDLNRKAFHEAIFYFMQERARGNDKLTHVVITDFHEWFVFDAQDFDRLFWRNTQLKKTFHAYHTPSLLTNTTKEVYEAIEKELPRMLVDFFTQESIDCAYFNLAAPETIKDKELVAIFKLLSPDSLLKSFNPNDANSLNREFYNELLYILGLEEVKDGGKRLIQAAGTVGSLYDGIADKLDQKGAPNEFEDVIKLIIIWINRVLFLKLLESQIVNWTGDKTSRFLNADKISSYDALEDLFFDTLARRIPDRKNKGFNYIPYLNSSLFEMQEDEKFGISISALPDRAQIAYYGKTVVKDTATKRKSGKANTLAYLFEFLDAYDFANDNDDEVREETKSLISASVLGLIFEKINGYKDGSFYTPSFVTMYMARQTIEKAILQKFNEKHGWVCTALTGEDGLKNLLKDHKVKKTYSNALIDSLKICDPAVGSGHFLVSVLNEILHIKSVLGLLVDEAGNLLDYSISIENDELIVTSDEGELFEYKKGSKEKTLVQKALFQEKQKIIENCLFGVDINPNSVNICRLRLWIELLKNAYYQPNGELETLPNIDINIKCGNSLISRFALDIDLKGALKKSKITVDEYRKAVSNYRNTSDKAEKRQIEALIERIKSNFRTEIQYYDPKQKRLEDLPKLIKALEASQSLLGETEKEEKERKQKQAKLQTEFTKLSIEIDEIKTNAIYKNAFEWRFEFPEVMDVEGNFIGFDVVIGNPPYGVDFETTEKYFYKIKYQDIHVRTPESYNYFVKQFSDISSNKGLCNLIIPSSFLNQAEFEKTRELLLKKHSPFMILNLGDAVFYDVATPTCLLGFDKQNKHLEAQYADLTATDRNQLTSQLRALENKIEIKQLLNNTAFSLIYRSDTSIIDKCYNNTPTLKDIAEEVATGVSSGLDKAYVYFPNAINEKKLESAVLKKLVVGGEIHRFHINPISGKKLIYITDESTTDSFPNVMLELLKYKEQLIKRREAENGKIKWFSLNWPRRLKLFEEPKILIRQTANRIMAAFDEDKWYCLKSGIIIQLPKTSKLSYTYLLGLLNSALMDFLYNDLVNEDNRIFPEVKPIQLFKLPIKIATYEQQLCISKIVTAILAAKKANPKTDTGSLEAKIDDMVYRLYDLTYDEVKTIEPEYDSLSREEYEAADITVA